MLVLSARTCQNLTSLPSSWFREHEEFLHNYARARQERLIGRYLVSLNATQTAVDAGFSKKTARQTGCENLPKPAIATEARAPDEAEGVAATVGI